MKRGTKPKSRRNIKDSVFTDLFRDKKYTLQLYKALHPEDKNVHRFLKRPSKPSVALKLNFVAFLPSAYV